jgi:hypothetical protein
MVLVRQRVVLEIPLPAEEVRRRLAAATAAWADARFGRAVPAPPWPGDGFAACEGSEGLWLALPVVVRGDVRPRGGGARLAAVLRPHPWAVAPYLLAALFLAGPALAGGAPLLGALWLLLVGAVAIHNLSSHVSERAAALRGVLAAALDAAPDAAPAP